MLFFSKNKYTEQNRDNQNHHNFYTKIEKTLFNKKIDY